MYKKCIRNLSIDLTKIYSLFKLFSVVVFIKYEVKFYRVHNCVSLDSAVQFLDHCREEYVV
jgi:hypothetical protein